MDKIKLIALASLVLLLFGCSGGGNSKKKECGQSCTLSSALLFSSLESSQKSSCEANRNITGESVYGVCISNATNTATRNSVTYRTDCQKKCDKK